MTADWVTAIATAGTFVVIAASACAALVQLRHMRASNQITAYNECRETLDSAEFREALYFIRTVLPERLREPGAAAAIVATGLTGEYAGVRLVANFFENMGLFVRIGMMERRIACELWAHIVFSTWNSLRPLLREIRRQVSPGIAVNFEYMAALSKQFVDAYSEESYPAGAPRMPLEDKG